MLKYTLIFLNQYKLICLDNKVTPFVFDQVTDKLVKYWHIKHGIRRRAIDFLLLFLMVLKCVNFEKKIFLFVSKNTHYFKYIIKSQLHNYFRIYTSIYVQECFI